MVDFRESQSTPGWDLLWRVLVLRQLSRRERLAVALSMVFRRLVETYPPSERFHFTSGFVGNFVNCIHISY